MKISGKTLTQLENKGQFVKIVFDDFANNAFLMGFEIHFNKALALDAYFQWMQDIQRIRSFEEEVTEPDHIKKCAHLIYWLRRNSPVNDLVLGGEDVPADIPDESVKFMLLYGREYLAFDFGYRIAKLYERSINGRNLPESAFSLQSDFADVADHDFLKTVVHVMKTKMISPQSLVIALKGAFLRP